MFDDVCAQLARDPNAGVGVYRVFMWAAHGGLSWQGWRQLRQSDLAELLSLSIGSVSEALKYLLSKGLLSKQGGGPRQEWMLTTEPGFRGTVSLYRSTRRAEVEGALAIIARRAGFDLIPDDQPCFDLELPGYVEPELAPQPARRWTAKTRGQLWADCQRLSDTKGPNHPDTQRARAAWDEATRGLSDRRKRAALAEARAVLGQSRVAS